MCSFYADKRYARVQPRTELLISQHYHLAMRSSRSFEEAFHGRQGGAGQMKQQACGGTNKTGLFIFAAMPSDFGVIRKIHLIWYRHQQIGE